MESIDQVSINAISTDDLLLILKSLEFTYENTKINDYNELKNSIIKELCFLTNSSESEFIKYLDSIKNL